MRKFLAVVSLILLGSFATPGVQAATTASMAPSMAATMKMPSTKAQIAAARSAHSKALKNAEYTDAILKGDTATVQKLLVGAGAPADAIVKIDNTRKPGATARARITITVTCCPLTITIVVK